MIGDRSEVVEHYERLLAPVYEWMIGGVDGAATRSRALFERFGLDDPNGLPQGTRRALDVGAGPGPQSLALARLGYRVTALDPSPTLIARLREHAADRRLEVVAAQDGAPLADRHPGPFDLAVCMTDTLVSLPDRQAARRLISDVALRLSPGGRAVWSWRDLTSIPAGEARFLPVRSDAQRILTCFLEDEGPEHVRVYDVLHEREGGGFRQRVSSYLKLRLSPPSVDGWLAEAGLAIEARAEDRGMHVRIARRPPP